MDEIEQTANLLARLYLHKLEETGEDKPRSFQFNKYDFYYYPEVLSNERIVFVTVKIGT